MNLAKHHVYILDDPAYMFVGGAFYVHGISHEWQGF